jgi:hypothetical protein
MHEGGERGLARFVENQSQQAAIAALRIVFDRNARGGDE